MSKTIEYTSKFPTLAEILDLDFLAAQSATLDLNFAPNMGNQVFSALERQCKESDDSVAYTIYSGIDRFTILAINQFLIEVIALSSNSPFNMHCDRLVYRTNQLLRIAIKSELK